MEQKALWISRNDADFVSDLFGLDELATYLQLVKPSSFDEIKVVAAESPEIPLTTVEGAVTAFQAGYSIILNSAEANWESVRHLAHIIQAAFASKIQCNIYCTPPRAQAFPTHMDAHDVLVVQTQGSKEWRIYEDTYPLPIQPSAFGECLIPQLTWPKFGTPKASFLLKPGDILYLPRGVPHNAIATDEPSVHLTFGIYPYRQYEWLQDILEHAAMLDVGLRHRVKESIYKGKEQPPSVSEMLRALADRLDGLEHGLDTTLPLHAHASRIARHKPTARNFLSGHYEEVDLNSRLRRPPNTKVTAYSALGEIHFRVGATEMRWPLKLKPVIPFFKNNACFEVKDMPKVLSDSAKVVLARNLVKKGLYFFDSQFKPEGD